MKSFLATLGGMFWLTVATGQEQPLYQNPAISINTRVEDLLQRMTLEEKILQLNQYTAGLNDVENNWDGYTGDLPAGIGSLIYFADNGELANEIQEKALRQTRLGIPVLLGHDVIHGYRTIFPIPLAQAASWNPNLMREAAAVAAREASACGIRWTFSPMVDIGRDPRWGRVMEGYGEDPYAASVFAKAVIIGYQGERLDNPGSIASCLKHFAGYGASEAGRDYTYTELSDQTLRDTYLPPFKAGVEAGAATIMSAFNNLNGTPATANGFLLRDVLKKEWNHDGFVVSDWNAIRQLQNQGMAEDGKDAARLAFQAGVEMDMVDNLYRQFLPELLEDGVITLADIDEAVRRVLTLKFRLGLFDHPFVNEVEARRTFCQPADMEVAEKLAEESMVLLKNHKGLLPLSRTKRIALIGPFISSTVDMLGNWCARGKQEETESLLDGLSAVFSHLVSAQGCDFESFNPVEIQEAVQLAQESDVVILCIGHRASWSGENCSRADISIPLAQEVLLREIHKTGRPVITLLCTGRPLDLSRIEPLSDAILLVWHPGSRGGSAVASLLSGASNPSGKLPVTFPRSVGQIPIYYNRRPMARTGDQGIYQDMDSEPLYPFGYGLSYASFEYGDPVLSSSHIRQGDTVTATVSVRNTSSHGGYETVFWYISDPVCTITRPVRELKFFEKKWIPAGKTVTFQFDLAPLRDLGFIDSAGKVSVDPGRFDITVGGRSVSLFLE